MNLKKITSCLGLFYIFACALADDDSEKCNGPMGIVQGTVKDMKAGVQYTWKYLPCFDNKQGQFDNTRYGDCVYKIPNKPFGKVYQAHPWSRFFGELADCTSHLHGCGQFITMANCMLSASQPV